MERSAVRAQRDGSASRGTNQRDFREIPPEKFLFSKNDCATRGAPEATQPTS